MRKVAVYAGTRQVYGQMAASCKSLLKHTHMDRVWLLIEDDVFPEPLPDVIQTINVSERHLLWFNTDGPNYKTQWTYMSLIRLALPALLGRETKVLWLDVDTIVEQDISELWDIPMDSYYAAMVEEPVRSKFPFTYYNAGVMLMNLAKLRMDDTWRKWIYHVNTTTYTAPDQDVINIFCQGEILTLPPELNDAGHITQSTEDPYIRHYAGSLKPLGYEVFEKYRNAEWEVK